MSKVFIKIQDDELARALAAALSGLLPAGVVAAGLQGSEDAAADDVPGEGDVVLDEERLDAAFSFLPVTAFAARLRSELEQKGAPSGFKAAGALPPLPEDCVFVAMTAGCGGCGLSSSAIALGRIYSRLYGFRTLYVSLSRLCRQAFYDSAQGQDAYRADSLVMQILSGSADRSAIERCVQKDEYGLHHFTTSSLLNPFCLTGAEQQLSLLAALCAEGGFERTILDIPPDHPALFELLAASEKRAVVFGPDETRRGCCERLLSAVPGAAELVHEWDPDSFGPEGADIHGQFGAEVRELAQRLETA